MKKFLLLQPFILFVVAIGIICAQVSALLGVILLVAGIILALVVTYWWRGYQLKKLHRFVKSLELHERTVIPVSSGGLRIDGLVITNNALYKVTPSSQVWKIDASNIESVKTDTSSMEYVIVTNDANKYTFKLHALKNRKQIVDTVSNPQTGVGMISVIGAPVLTMMSAMQLSASSSIARTEAMNALLVELTDGRVVPTAEFEGKVKLSDITLGIALGIELVALIIAAVFLFYSES